MIKHEDNKQLAHHLAELLISNPEQFMVEFPGLIQAKLRQEVASQLETTLQVLIDKIGKGKTTDK